LAASELEKKEREEETKVIQYTGVDKNLINCDIKLLEIAKSVKEALGIHNMLTEKDLSKD